MAEKKEQKSGLKAKKVTDKKVKRGHLGQEIKVKLFNGSEFNGLCISERNIPGNGTQVFLKLNGFVSRWFNCCDIVE